jgi:3-oxoacyl-[acyl-carrier protein] reductase
MSNETKTEPKAALVFGGSRGIGAAAVSRLVRDGFSVAFTYVSKPDTAKELVDSLTGQGGEAFSIAADSADPKAIRAAVDQAVKRFGPLSVVVVNAGLYRVGTVDSVSLEELDLMLNVNVRGVYLSIQAAAAQMRDGGRVITIGSNVAIRTGSPGVSVYQFTKAAVAAMVKGLALDLAPRKITVNNVQPGPTETDLTSGFLDYLSERSPLHRVAKPEEIAGLISYLAGEESSYVTGSSLTIDGGFVL